MLWTKLLEDVVVAILAVLPVLPFVITSMEQHPTLLFADAVTATALNPPGCIVPAPPMRVPPPLRVQLVSFIVQAMMRVNLVRLENTTLQTIIYKQRALIVMLDFTMIKKVGLQQQHAKYVLWGNSKIPILHSAFSCKPCVGGKYSNAARQTSCVICSIGKYQTEIQQVDCKKCPPGSHNVSFLFLFLLLQHSFCYSTVSSNLFIFNIISLTTHAITLSD